MVHDPQPPTMTAPVIEGRWIRPSAETPAEPRWGHADGIQVGIAPLGGPRGLLRIYAPYLEHEPRERLVNFIAIEPLASGQPHRGLSELEQSALDGVRGKRFWSADDPSDPTPRPELEPARGVVETVDGVERLRVFVLVEPFDNGADVYVRLSFRADRPHEVAIATHARESSVPLELLATSATMGNYARLRQLHLADRVVTPAELWPGFSGTDFAEHAKFGLDEFRRTESGDATVSATPDELELHTVAYSDDTAEHWKYTGKRATQTWTAEAPRPGLEVWVNARWAYWASSSPIPGGPSYENFELIEPFEQGREFLFSIDPLD